MCSYTYPFFVFLENIQVFNLVDPVLSIAAALSVQSPFVRMDLNNEAAINVCLKKIDFFKSIITHANKRTQII